jgi:hypothetical protein
MWASEDEKDSGNLVDEYAADIGGRTYQRAYS